MTLYIRVDIHARQQTVSYLDTEDGSIEHQELHHERDDIRAFYSQFSGEVIVGIEACGYPNWFEELVEEIGHKLLVEMRRRSGGWSDGGRRTIAAMRT